MIESRSLSYNWLNAPAVDEQSSTANETRKISSEDKDVIDEKILEFFNKQEPGSKINVERSVKEINKNLPKDQQISESIITNRLKDKKFNTNFLDSQTFGQYHGELSDSMKQNIIDTFGEEFDIDFKKGKYGVSAGSRWDKGKGEKDYRSLKGDDDVLVVDMKRALELLAMPKRGRGGRTALKDLGIPKGSKENI